VFAINHPPSTFALYTRILAVFKAKVKAISGVKKTQSLVLRTAGESVKPSYTPQQRRGHVGGRPEVLAARRDAREAVHMSMAEDRTAHFMKETSFKGDEKLRRSG